MRTQNRLLARFAAIVALAACAAVADVTDAEAACNAAKPGSELTGVEAKAVYDCLKDAMVAGYAKGDKQWVPQGYVADYRSWTPASTFPAAPGFHGERFLLTYVNPVGAALYLQYLDTGVTMPAGTVIAKESFSVDGQGKASAGPLFLMEKVKAGTSPQTGDWYYMMVAPDGSPQAVNVVEACHACHAGFEGSDGLGYPVPEARVR